MIKFDFFGCDTIHSALALVDNDCKLRNPLKVRRLQFYWCKQNKHEVYSDYVIRLKTAAKEVDVFTMSTGHIIAIQIMGGCNYAEL